MSYQSKDGTWNDKANKTCNNKWCYGGYAKLLGLDVSGYDNFFKVCRIDMTRDNIKILRRQNKLEPPFSHDEALGMFLLGYLPYDILKGNHFVFNGHGKPFKMSDLQKIAEGLMELLIHLKINFLMPKKKKIKERNLFWKRRVEKLYTIAYRLNPSYIYMVKRISGKKPHEEERVLWKFYYENLLKNKSNDTSTLSQKNLMWALLIADGDEKRARKLNPVDTFTRYFGPEHPFSIAMKKRYS